MNSIRVWLLVAVVALCTVGARAQSDTGPEAGSHDLEIWAAGGHSIKGGEHDISVVNAGARYGWVFTNLHGPGPLSGRFEYGFGVVPLFVIVEPKQTVYGLSFDPFYLRWNFRQRHRIMPYAELTGGALFTNHAVPVNANAVNFTPSGGFGISVPHGRYRWIAELHFLHISDAALTQYNPGINTLQLRIGFSLYGKRQE